MDFAIAADETVDLFVTNNTQGRALFTVEGDEYFVNGKIIHHIYSTLATMGNEQSPFGELELLNLSYLLAAIESRSRGVRLADEMKSVPGSGF
jgi:hypothetical protein